MLTLALTIWMVATFDSGEAGYQFVTKHTWIEEWGISWHLGVDGISLLLVALTGLLFPLSMVAVQPHHDDKSYLAWLLLLEAGMMGSFLSLDLFMFFVFFEVVLVPMYFLIGGWGYEGRVTVGAEVLPVHHVRLGVHARRRRRHSLPGPRQRGRPVDVRPHGHRRASRLPDEHRTMAVLRASPSPSP